MTSVTEKMAAMRRVWVDFLLFELVGVGLGMMIGIFVSDQAQSASGLTDPTHYQNFALLTGAIAGFAIVLLALLCYLSLTRFYGHRETFPFRLFISVAGIAGAAISLATFCIVTASAGSHGMVERTGAVAVVDGVISTILGGGTGAVLSAVLSEIRGYNQ